MSGLEIAGLILGAIPVAIETLKMGSQGIAILQRCRRYENELDRLINKLENERVRLEDVCEKVLVDLVPHSRIEELIQNPDRLFNDDPELKDKLRGRLWKGCDLFDQTLKEINYTMNEAINRISLQIQDESNIRRSLRHSFLDDLLSRINEGVSALEQLVHRSIQLEPARKIRAQGKFMCYMRGIASELFAAVKAGFGCPCEHHVGLQLEKWTSNIAPDDIRPESLIGGADFHLSLSYKGPGTSPAAPTSHDTKWSDVLVKPAPIMRSQAMAKPSRSRSKFEQRLEYSRPTRLPLFKGASFSTVVDSTQPPGTSQELEMITREEQVPSTKILDLCGTVRQPFLQTPEACFGLIFNTSVPKARAYDVYPIIPSNYRKRCVRTVTSLNEVLGQNQRHIILSEQDRLKLAVVIASSLLQLYGSSWIPKVIRSQDIYLIQGPDDPICDRFFVLQSLPQVKEIVKEENQELTSMRNQTLFYLGVLLIELAFGKPLELLRSERDKSSIGSQFFTDYRTAKRLVDQVNSFVGPSYGSAVSRCIDGEFHSSEVGLEDTNLSHDVYTGVVMLLEKSIGESLV
ncbi:hypothetical protein Focb16_v009426 [Fusarium oxysporum f. sp. cubense]|uniref:DUF7580 domain-containing protein n=1 Tax=Fusarium oxysporum f. sp. cubense TaxID=61366 RepID=A0A559LX90_FUSOC|nr:hypothetical protein Focb16_v009426 [Fusarium oxysporum f. sp. cubense]